MAGWRIQGAVFAGQGRGAGFTALPWVREQVLEHFGIEPRPGTLNLRLDPPDVPAWSQARTAARAWLEPPDPATCRATCLPVVLGGRLPGVAVVPHVTGYADDHVEVIAAVELRAALQAPDGVPVSIADARIHDLAAVVFDVDGTLVNSLEGMWLAASRAAALYGYEVPRDAVRRALNEGESLWTQIIPEADRHHAELPGILRQETLRHWPDVLAESVDLLPGVAALLADLRAAGRRLAIYTGSRGESFLPLRRAGVLDLFDVVLTASDVGRPKPDPEGLVACLDRLGCAPGEAVYVGDSHHDMAAARAAGMQPVGVLGGAATSAGLTGAGAARLARHAAGLRRILLEGE